MHGRKRSTREEHDPPEVRTLRIEKYRQYLQSCKVALISEEAAVKAEKILRFNPDFLTLWNSRRRGILKTLESSVDDPIETRKQILLKELSLTKEQISERNPKSYGAWFHRLWAIENLGYYNGTQICDLKSELQLCDLLLTKDERNFHCWNYRNFIAKLDHVTSDEILGKSTSLIEKNFSNYSAWHLRVQALKENPLEDWTPEFELIHQAIFTEPADQSAWLYFRWLMTKFFDDKERVQEELEIIKSLLDEEGDCKWPLLSMLQLHACLPDLDTPSLCLVKDVSQRLQKIDPGHAKFYEYVQSLFLAQNQDHLRKTLFCVNRIQV